MAVSPEVYKRLLDANPVGGAADSSATPDAKDLPTEVPEEKVQGAAVGSGEYLWNELKQGLASGPEMANWVARGALYPAWSLLPDRFKRAIQPGVAAKTVGVDEDVLRGDPGALTSMVGGAAQGLGMTPYAFLGPVRGAKVATDAVETLAQKIAPYLRGLEKSALVSVGAGEGSELGKSVGGGIGEFLGGEKGKETGEATGSILGGTAGGYANVVRVNAMAEAAKAAGRATKTGVSAIAPAMKAAFAAKAAGDTRNLFSLYFDQYQDLRKSGLGFLQERTNAKIADLISRDPTSAQSIEDFYKAAGTVLKPGEESLFSTTQISDNPTLYRMEAARRELGGKEGAEAFSRESARRQVLTSAFKRITDSPLPTNQQGMEAAINAYGTTQLGKIASLENDASQVRTGVTNLSSEGMRENGAFLRQEWEKELAQSRQVNERNYQQAFDLDTQGVDIAPVKATTKAILDKFESRIKEGTAPQSIVNLKTFIQGQQKVPGADIGLILPEAVAKESATKEVRVPLKDLDRVVKDLGSDANRYYRSFDATRNNADLATARNLDQVRNELLGAVGTTNPEAAAAYQAAQGRYATEHAPRFNTGVASAMEVERTAAGTRGRPRIVNERLFNEFLNKAELPTRMDEFDRTFGGFGGAKRNEAAYRELGKAVEDKFSKEVLNTGFSPDKAAKFADEYKSALDRLPMVRDKLARTAERLDAIKMEQEAVTEDFKTLTGSAVTKDIGPMAAQQLFTQALGDPRKMKQLLNSPIANTPDKAKAVLKEAMLYANPVTPKGVDYTRLATLMEAGQHRVDMPNTLEMLTTAALGPKEGAAQLDRLKMISELMRRDAMIDPEHLRLAAFTSADSPVKGVTGQTMASWLTGFRSMNAGFGKNYFPAISAGRFVNAQIQKAVDETVRKALYDPEASKAVLSLAATPMNQPLTDKVLDAVFGNAPKIKALVSDNLLEKGLAKKMTGRGTAIGTVTYLTDQERQRKRDERRKEMGNRDLGE